MNCTRCHSDTRVVKTTKVTIGKGEVRVRERECNCGMRYESQERLTKSYSPPATHGQPTGKHRQIGGCSSSDSDLLFPDLSDPPDRTLSETLQRVDPAREAAKKGRGDAVDYPAEFEQLWAACKGKKGNKLPAFKAWKKNKPPLTLTIERWELWMTTAGWSDGYSQHMSTWLNERGWENVPDPVQFKRRVNGRLESVANAPKRSAGPPIAIAEHMAERATQLEKAAEIERAAAAERFRQQWQQDAGGET